MHNGININLVAKSQIKIHRSEISGKNEATLKLHWWDGSAWVTCSDSGVNTTTINGYSGYIWANINDSTIPTLDDLSGTPFGATAVAEQPSSPAPPPSGGGGGGGARGITAFAELMNPDGALVRDVIAVSSDLQVFITMSGGTQPRGREGGVIYWVSIQALSDSDEVPEGPEGVIPVSPCYKMEPDGATFEPPVTGTFSYKLWKLPEGVNVDNLVVMWWDEVMGQWVPMGGQVDPDEDTFTVELSHFSFYQLMAMNRPADIAVTEITVEPAGITAGSNATVNAIICNSGDCAGDYEAVLMLNGVTYSTQDLTVNGGEEVPVSFALTSLEAGTYVLALGGQTLEFRVTAEPLPAAFTVASLDVSPAEVDPGEEVSISATVTNTGDMSGICEVVLSIDGEIIETREVTLAGDASREVIFSITPDKSGRQIIEVNGAIGSLEVRGEVPAPEPIPTYAGETEPVSEPEIPETVGILPEEPSTNWGIIGGIIAAVVVVIGLAAGYFFWWRKRGVSGQPPAAMS